VAVIGRLELRLPFDAHGVQAAPAPFGPSKKPLEYGPPGIEPALQVAQCQKEN